MQMTSFENQDIMKNMIFLSNTKRRFFKALVFIVFTVYLSKLTKPKYEIILCNDEIINSNGASVHATFVFKEEILYLLEATQLQTPHLKHYAKWLLLYLTDLSRVAMAKTTRSCRNDRRTYLLEPLIRIDIRKHPIWKL